jgi:hypothetical protein
MQEQILTQGLMHVLQPTIEDTDKCISDVISGQNALQLQLDRLKQRMWKLLATDSH